MYTIMIDVVLQLCVRYTVFVTVSAEVRLLGVF